MTDIALKLWRDENDQDIARVCRDAGRYPGAGRGDDPPGWDEREQRVFFGSQLDAIARPG